MDNDNNNNNDERLEQLQRSVQRIAEQTRLLREEIDRTHAVLNDDEPPLNYDYIPQEPPLPWYATKQMRVVVGVMMVSIALGVVAAFVSS